MGFIDKLFGNKNQSVIEKEIMGSSCSDFFSDIYLMATEKHLTSMLPILNDFIQNGSTGSAFGEPGSVPTMAFLEGCSHNITKEIYCYYYFIFHEIVFSKMKNDKDMNYNYFKTKFSNNVYSLLDENEIVKNNLYQNMDDEYNPSDWEDLMLNEDRNDPQFYKEIIEYYDSNEIKPLPKPYVDIILPYFNDSDIVSHHNPDLKIKNGMLYCISMICYHMKCAPQDPTPEITFEACKNYIRNQGGDPSNLEFNVETYTYPQYNSHYFNRTFDNMIDNMYTQTFSIKSAVEQTL